MEEVKKEELNREIERREKNLLTYGEIRLVLRDYEEIFSDFDARSYSQRAMSVDFLDEARRALRDVDPSGFELKILMPKAKRSAEKEELIRHRLREHSRKHHEILEKKRKEIIKQGFYFTVAGFIFMLFGAYILFYDGARSFLKEFLVILLEPGGWFFFWEGLDLVIFKSKEIKGDLDFYRKMNKAKIIFSHY